MCLRAVGMTMLKIPPILCVGFNLFVVSSCLFIVTSFRPWVFEFRLTFKDNLSFIFTFWLVSMKCGTIFFPPVRLETFSKELRHSSSWMDYHRNTFISEINCQNLNYFWTLQKPRLPQEIVSLMWILKVTDLAIVASLVMNTRSVPLGKWREVIKENEWLQNQSCFITPCDSRLSPP